MTPASPQKSKRETMKKILAALAIALLAAEPAFAGGIVNNTAGGSGTVSSGTAGQVGVYTGSTTIGGVPTTNAITSFVTNPVSGASAEYPMTDGSGTTLSDISGNANTATFCAGANAPTWLTYGVSFPQYSTTCIQTPILTFKTVLLHLCSNFTTGLPGNSYATPLGHPSTGLDILATDPGGAGAAVFNGIALNPGLFKTATSSFTTSTSLGAVPTKSCSVLALTLDTNDHFYLDGIEEPYSTQGASASSVTVASGYYLGAEGTNAAKAYNGTIDYAVFYPNVLTQNQIKQVSNFIIGQVTTRPAYPNYVSQPTYQSPANIIACIGDSLTYGLQGSPWCNATYMTPLTNTYSFYSNGLGGRLAHDTVSGFQSQDLPFLSNNGGKNICNFWLGTNDIAQTSLSAASAWTALQSLGKQAANANCIPIVTTMISRSGQDTGKNSLNALIRANWRTAFAALHDIAAIPALGADGAYANPVATCFYSDGTHLINTGTCYNGLSGYPVVGWNLTRVIDIIDGSTADNPTVTTSNAYSQAIGDNYVLQTPSAAATATLPDCTGLTSIQRTIINGSATYAITTQTSASQTVTGSPNIPANSTATFTCELVSAAAGGNYWLRTN